MSTSTLNPQANSLAWALACWIAGAGILGAIVYFTVIPISELLGWALVVWLPLIGIAIGTGLISIGWWHAFKAALGGGFQERVRYWVKELERNPEAQPA
jgi:hypothetical protein